jgi:hypothetical protein
MANLDGGEFLADLLNKDVRHGMLLQRIIKAVNSVAQASGVAPVGHVAAPTPPDSISVATAGELVHVSLTHNAPVNRGIHYFTEISSNPAFNQPIVHDHGTSRTPPPFSLPTKDGNGNTMQYYVRSYSQYPGSAPSAPVVHGGIGSPTPITMGGSTQLTLLPSSGSGTAPSNGQSAGQGFGKQSSRPGVGPKRTV